MVTCQYCGAKNPNGASFCDGCGAALTTSVAAHAQSAAQDQLAAAHAARAQATAKQSAVHANPQFGTGRLPPQTMLGGRYLVLKTIGRGGMAAVYQASDTKGSRLVAIKEMSQENLSSQELTEALDGFRREAGLLQNLKHPNLPQVFANFSENGRHYLVMEFIDGDTLEQKLVAAKGPLPEAEVMGWARQLCDALAYLHGQRPPIIFRDLKPANVMVTRKGQVKLIDFGIARLFSNRQSRDTQALGTPGYAPPEQYGSAQTDVRADIYALGATLYHLLTNYDVGRTPFALPPLRSRNSAVSERTASAIERATRLDRNDRYATVTDFAQALAVNAKAGPRAAPKTRPAPGAQAGGPFAGARAGQAWPGQQPPGAAQGAARPAQGIVGSTVETAMRAATAGVVAASAAVIKSRMNPQAPQKSPAAAFRDAAIAAARTSTGNQAALTVQPREIDLNQLRAGQDGSATLTISGLNNAPVAGALKPLTPWVHLDRAQFNGVSTLVQVTARTSEIHSAGPQQGTIEVTMGNQRMYIPVRVRVIPAAPVVRPQPQPAYQAPPPVSPQGVGAQARPQAAAGRGAAQQTAAYAAAPRQPGAGAAMMARVRSLDGLRLALSLILALLFAFGLPAALNAFAVPQLGAYLTSPAWTAWALLASGVIAALIAAPLAYIGGARTSGRLRTGGLLAAVGAALAITNGPQLQLTSALTQTLPGATQLGALALTLPLLVAIGAAVGAQPLVSRSILAVARYIAARYRLVVITAAIVGGWVGLTAAQMAVSGAFQQAPVAISLISGCGLIVGVALGLMLATPVGYLVRRFAFG
ncbi:MAG TPA: serine/threonine-protein kinase [Ktedonobacterales bacterium]|nr:serine/threonine-protein kinase [Ktedonobacterales bacterium]